MNFRNPQGLTLPSCARVGLSVVLAAVFLICPTHLSWAEQSVRIATYNIRFLNTGAAQQGDRLDKLRQVIESLEADAIGLQEIADRTALELLFPPNEWQIVIDDDSSDDQDLAAVVRRPFRILNIGADLDADDEHFLFPDSADNFAFPNRRDVLRVAIELPDGSDRFILLVNHTKSRFDRNPNRGRATNDPQRELAATRLVQALEPEIDGTKMIYVCDCNDSPDDRSANILETGDPAAAAGMEELPGPFMINLTEPLYAEGHVSHGRKSNELTPDGLRVDTIDLGSRQRNHDARGTNENTGDILFDQIYVSPTMFINYEQGSAAVFNDAIAVRGNNTTRASDHLPVFADFTLGATAEEPPPPILRIVALLPNPDGEDHGNEMVTLANGGADAVSLNGWRLRDRAGNQFMLEGSVPANDELRIVMTTFAMPLNNSGDRVTLLDPQQNPVSVVEYNSSQVASGVEVLFDN